ncbi:hypothetical protein WJX73_006059 [Symbiochloris irregularis]|uniref:Uncharacterized protein n=1 Tax=Symbiochloris irregularis TaxID=706552 RepID=A0AAW1NKE9_9CHLO
MSHAEVAKSPGLLTLRPKLTFQETAGVPVGNYTLESLQWGRVEDFTNITHPRPAYHVSTAHEARLILLMAMAADLYGAGIRDATKFPQNISYSSSFLYPCAAPPANQPFAGAAKTGCPPVDQVSRNTLA